LNYFYGYTNLSLIVIISFSFISINLIELISVGAGSAGTILATRLSEDGDSVLLLEAGGIAPPFLDIPLLAPMIQRTAYDWQYVTVSQKYACKGLINNVNIFL